MADDDVEERLRSLERREDIHTPKASSTKAKIGLLVFLVLVSVMTYVFLQGSPFM